MPNNSIQSRIQKMSPFKPYFINDLLGELMSKASIRHNFFLRVDGRWCVGGEVGGGGGNICIILRVVGRWCVVGEEVVGGGGGNMGCCKFGFCI